MKGELLEWALSALFLTQALRGAVTEVPPQSGHLNTGPQVVAVGEDLGGVALLEELYRGGQAHSLKAVSSSLTLLPVCGWRCDLLPSVPDARLPHFPGVIMTVNTYLSEAMRPR